MKKKSDSKILSAMDKALTKARETEAEFIIVRGEKSFEQLITAEKDTIRDVSSQKNIGIGIEVVFDNAKGYGYTSKLGELSIDNTIEKALNGAKRAARVADKEMFPKEMKHQKYEGKKPKVKKHPRDVETEEKVDLLLSGTNAILEDDVASLRALYGESWSKRWVQTSDGLNRNWQLLKTGVSYRPVVRKNGKMGAASEQSVASLGLSLFNKDGKTPRETAKKALNGARDMAKASTFEPGRYSIVADPEFIGVVAHESFGHLTEADGVITGSSILSDRKGEKLGSKHATIMESGDPKDYGFYLPYDDEGTATKEFPLLEDGVLKNFLHSRYTAEILDEEPTGNGRAINFRYPSIVRMRNTYFTAGNHTKEELFEKVENGIYVVGSKGGQTEATGTFTFAADRAYRIEDGEKKAPVKGAVVRGHILNFLKNIVGKSKEIEVSTSLRGGCGKSGQSPLPVGNGGPYTAVENAIIGGGK